MRWIELEAPDFDVARTLDSGQVFHWEKCGDGYAGTIAPAASMRWDIWQRMNTDFYLDADATPPPSVFIRVNLWLMRWRELEAPDFDLSRTLDSGQVFHWEKCGDGFAGTIGPRGVFVEQRKKRLRFSGVTAETITSYFALDHPLAEICRSFPDDPALTAARAFCQGLRIIRQPRWECLATFITSSMKQVAHIRQISRTLRTRYGQRHRVRECAVPSFPTPSRVAKLTEPDLRACALGYRAKNLLATARLVASGDADLEHWSSLSDETLRARLCELPGVGAKVANCVMLFAYERLRAFPIDVWIERVLRQKYFPNQQKVTATQLRAFCETYFGEHGGYAQQYLFHHARKAGATPRTAAP